MDILNYKKVFALFIFLFSCSCQITYLTKSAYQQIWILSHREPIEKVIQEKTLKADEIKKLEIANLAREFASQTMHLKIGKSYSTFVQLKKAYVVWAVNASEKWQLKHFIWNYPIVGELPYKGFPDEKDAHIEADIFDKEKYDTYIRGVSAYSTLGWFADPILSSMLNYTEYNLINTIFHESAHATIFIKNSADFNERLASFVGNIGTEMFYKKLEGDDSDTLKTIKLENRDELLFSTFISEEIKELENFYKTNQNKSEEMRQQRFAGIIHRFKANLKPQLQTKLYANFDQIKLNNARLLLFKTYMEDLSDFENLFRTCKYDFDKFLNSILKLENSKNPTSDLKSMLADLKKAS